MAIPEMSPDALMSFGRRIVAPPPICISLNRDSSVLIVPSGEGAERNGPHRKGGADGTVDILYGDGTGRSDP